MSNQNRRDVLTQLMLKVVAQPALLVGDSCVRLSGIFDYAPSPAAGRYTGRQIPDLTSDALLNLFNKWRGVLAEPCSSPIRIRRFRSAKRTL